MKIGVPKETKKNEARVGLTPANVQSLVEDGHEVIVGQDAGLEAGFTSREYEEAGAYLKDNPFDAELIVKVKEPTVEECSYLSKGQTLFTFLHLAANKPVLDALVESGAIAIAYENVEDSPGSFPILRPMSVIAGRLAVQIGMQTLQWPSGGKGILFGMGGTYPYHAVPHARVVIIGMGEVGRAAVEMALANDAEVVGMDILLGDLILMQIQRLRMPETVPG